MGVHLLVSLGLSTRVRSINSGVGTDDLMPLDPLQAPGLTLDIDRRWLAEEAAEEAGRHAGRRMGG
jgi:hypothetical protein